MRDNVVWEQIRADDLEAPEFVRELLGRVARRIDDGQEDNDKAELGTPLSESDIRRLTDTEIESLAQKIATYNTWLFESYADTMRSMHTDDKDRSILSVKRRKTQ